MTYERITNDPQFDGKIRDSHETRYRIASGFVLSGDYVVDMCCGTGYGKSILSDEGGKYIKWNGYDKNPPNWINDTHKIDLENKLEIGEMDFDVFVGLEAIEHLNDTGVENFLCIANYAQGYVIISTPVIPNSNPYHKQQFSRDDIHKLARKHLVDFDEYMYLEQDDTYGIFIYKHK